MPPLMHSRTKRAGTWGKQFAAIFWEIQFGRLDGAGGSEIVHILYAVRKGTATKRGEEKSERRGSNEEKKCQKVKTFFNHFQKQNRNYVIFERQ